MPKKGSVVKFNNGQNQFMVPFMIYADFESILNPIEDGPEPKGLFTKIINHHIPSGFCFYSKFAYGEVKGPLMIYQGKDCMSTFCKLIKREAKRLYDMFPEKPMEPLTSSENRNYGRLTKCHTCLKPFHTKHPKVRGHCHYTGKYRGPAHRICNLNYKIPHYIPVIFHNISGYDTHLFIQELGKEMNELGVITKNREDYITFLVDIPVNKYMDKDGIKRCKNIQLRFIDSFKLMGSSLETLTNNLVSTSGNRCDSCKEIRKLTHIDENYVAHGKCKDCHENYGKRKLNKELILKKFHNLKLGHADEQFRLLLSKGVYPYEYMTSWEKFNETNLPLKEAFYSNLNDSDINDHEYSRVHRVWK